MSLRGSRRRASWFGENDNLEKWYRMFTDRRAREIGLLAHRWVNQSRYFQPGTGYVTIWDVEQQRKHKRRDRAG